MPAKPASDKDKDTDSSSGAEAGDKAKKSLLHRLLLKRWIPIVLILSVVLHGLFLLCWPAAVRAKLERPTEIELGKFHFINHEKNARLAQAQFNLHVSLLLGTENAGGNRLSEKKFLVQQGIEELLRQSHAADFDDPTLAELKRQIQEKVNEAVEMRTVESVIITRLETEERQLPPKTSVASFEHSPAIPKPAQAASVAPGSLDSPPAGNPAKPASAGSEPGTAG